MHIAIPFHGELPVSKYGGTQRVIWSLGRGLVEYGHQVTFLCKINEDTHTHAKKYGFNIIEINEEIPIEQQVPDDIDIIHFQVGKFNTPSIPYITTIHGNPSPQEKLDIQSVFLTRNHASRYQADAYVYNGLDWDEYPEPDLGQERSRLHFLAKAAWKVKNVRGAIDISKRAKLPLDVMGGTRINFKMGFRLTLNRNVTFHGMVNNDQKARIIQKSRGLLFPVRWHEPFGLAVIESAYYGAPIYSTPYGSLTELSEIFSGALGIDSQSLASSVRITKLRSHELNYIALKQFSHRRMASDYIQIYHKILSDESINSANPQLKKEFITHGELLPWN